MKIATLFLLPLVLACLALPAPAIASADDVLSFAEALFAEGDHYRAITEYKRFGHLYPDHPQRHRATLGIGESLLAGKRWQQAEGILDTLLADAAPAEIASRAALLRAEIPYRQGNFSLARERLQQLAGQATEPAERNSLRRRIAWTHLEEDNFSAAQQELADIAPELAEEVRALQELPRKSPRLAAGLSALLPGAGQLYAGRPRDAALALALNGAFVLGALESFNSGNPVVGSILLFFEAGWYTGNIFNAANHAQRYNRRQREEAKDRLRLQYGVTLGPSGRPAGIVLGARF